MLKNVGGEFYEFSSAFGARMHLHEPHPPLKAWAVHSYAFCGSGSSARISESKLAEETFEDHDGVRYITKTVTVIAEGTVDQATFVEVANLVDPDHVYRVAEDDHLELRFLENRLHLLSSLIAQIEYDQEAHDAALAAEVHMVAVGPSSQLRSLPAHVDAEAADLSAKFGFSADQIRLAVQLYTSGVPVRQIRDTVSAIV